MVLEIVAQLDGKKNIRNLYDIARTTLQTFLSIFGVFDTQ